MTDRFRVSVIIPVFNAATNVRQAVKSALDLTDVGEVILVEDGSTDDSLAECEALVKELPHVRLLRHRGGVNEGAGASRNLGVSQAQFDYVAFLDADDWYLPGRFEADRHILSSDPSIDGVYNALRNEYEDKTVRAQWLAQGRPDFFSVSAPVTPEELPFVLLWSHPSVTGEFSTITITVRRSFFDRVGGFHTGLRLQQDTHLWKRMAAVGRLVCGNISTPVAIRRVHSGNRMTRLDDQDVYRELWWSSLYESFQTLNVRPEVMQAWRRAYSSFRATRGPRRRAIVALGSWAIRSSHEVTIPYGHFDLTLRALFNHSVLVLRLLSLKNRLFRRSG